MEQTYSCLQGRRLACAIPQGDMIPETGIHYECLYAPLQISAIFLYVTSESFLPIQAVSTFFLHVDIAWYEKKSHKTYSYPLNPKTP